MLRKYECVLKRLRISYRLASSLSRSLIFQPKQNFHNMENNNFDPTYTSKFNLKQPKEVETYLRERQIQFRENSQGYLEVKYCMFCKRPHNNELTNLYKLHINKSTGSYVCHRASCDAKGSWYDFRNHLNGTLRQQDEVEIKPLKNQKMNELQYFPLFLNTLNAQGKSYQYVNGKNYIKGDRGIEHEVLTTYRIGLGEESFVENEQKVQVECVYFPMYRKRNKQEVDKLKKELQDKQTKLINENTQELENQLLKNQGLKINDEYYELVKCKVRGASKEEKQFQKVIPSGASEGIFGINTVPQNVDTLIITEGEFDAMAAYQVTGIPSISLPYGAKHMPDYLVKWLDQYPQLKLIYLWLDEDDAGRLNAPKISKKLGSLRCRTVRTAYEHDDGCYPKDANDALREFPEKIAIYLKNAKNENQKNILVFQDLEKTIRNKFLSTQESEGIKCTTLPVFNKTIKGLRNGELSIITGPTGSGKTTFLSQLSLDLCSKGVNTLWGSFEIKNERFLQNMMLQFSGCNLSEVILQDKKAYEYVCQKFKDIPIYLMNFYGTTDVYQVIDTIEYAVHQYQISHVCLDNLQFMMGNQEKGIKKFELQDEVIEKLRKIATNSDIHISVIIHPRKVDESEDLNISSVFGTAKATQEADNVFIVQNRGPYRIFDIKKNRYDGDLGRSPLAFDKTIKMYFELTTPQALALSEKKTTVGQLIKERKEKNNHFPSILDEYQQMITKYNGGGNDNNNGSGGNSSSIGDSNYKEPKIEVDKIKVVLSQPTLNKDLSNPIKEEVAINEINLLDIKVQNESDNQMRQNGENDQNEQVKNNGIQSFKKQKKSKQDNQITKSQKQQETRKDDKIQKEEENSLDQINLDDYLQREQFIDKLETNYNYDVDSEVFEDLVGEPIPQQSKTNVSPLDFDQSLGVKIRTQPLKSFYSDNKIRSQDKETNIEDLKITFDELDTWLNIRQIKKKN